MRMLTNYDLTINDLETAIQLMDAPEQIKLIANKLFLEKKTKTSIIKEFNLKSCQVNGINDFVIRIALHIRNKLNVQFGQEQTITSVFGFEPGLRACLSSMQIYTFIDASKHSMQFYSEVFNIKETRIKYLRDALVKRGLNFAN